ncbi:very long chain fatty acid elongase AAEL008004-like [Cloeon dipterum]|uniref:Elongation of very long chain fatty acids protein n=2 Tax=Cloeon dipterum TaxID=197152 RepID=A0A8S1D1Q3_9INSE|nr:Hypothetical predicted protein [Cloeon dipterum]
MAQIVKEVIDYGLNYWDSISDPRTSKWPLMSSPFPTLLMVAGYLYTVLILGPTLMDNRKPFKLREVLIVYNAAQVIYSAAMFYEHLMSGWLFDYSYSCQPVDYSLSPVAMRMAHLCWWYYISKLTEFLDTLFFVMRKKNNQISLLHVYHHSMTPIMTWVLVRFLAGGHGTFSNLINNLVHVVMYFYYMMTAMGPQYQKYIWWKKHLTTVQLVQFLMVFVHSANALFSDCSYPKLISAFLVVHSCIFFGLFLDFYIKAYRRDKSRKGSGGLDSSLKGGHNAPTLQLAPLLTPAAEGPTPKTKTQ